MVDHEALGAEGVPFTMHIERGKVWEFARAVHAHDQSGHTEGDHPVAPPTFLTSQFFWEEQVPGANPWDQVKMSQERGMHASQEYIFHGPPPRTGDRLTATSRITRIFDKQSRSAGKLTFVEMVTEFRDDAGTLRAEAILTGVETEAPPEHPS